MLETKERSETMFNKIKNKLIKGYKKTALSTYILFIKIKRFFYFREVKNVTKRAIWKKQINTGRVIVFDVFLDGCAVYSYQMDKHTGAVTKKQFKTNFLNKFKSIFMFLWKQRK